MVDSGATFWNITPGGDDGVCSSSEGNPEDTCGPERRFISNATKNSSNQLNSSLNVFLTDDLNGTLVQCIDGEINGSGLIGNVVFCIPSMFYVSSYIQYCHGIVNNYT